MIVQSIYIYIYIYKYIYIYIYIYIYDIIYRGHTRVHPKITHVVSVLNIIQYKIHISGFSQFEICYI